MTLLDGLLEQGYGDIPVFNFQDDCFRMVKNSYRIQVVDLWVVCIWSNNQ